MLETYILPQGLEGPQETLKPSIHIVEATDTYGKVSLEPLQQGYGITVGNPLRRILLSSIKGSAITWVKIENVVHEYTAIPGVKEEVMDLLLNIKRIRIHSQSERTGKMRLEVAGEGRICAGDIATSADFEIVNPELHLATLDSADANLFIEFNVEPGVGYQPATQSEGVSGLPVGVLPVDAIFNPVRKVDYSVERTRVGQVTDYERLVLEVWTDGTITPVEALREAADTLVQHFFLYTDLSRASDTRVDRPSLNLSPEIYQTPIERLDLSARTLNCLKRAHITRVGEVLEMSDDELLKVRNFGEKSLTELRERLAERGMGSPSRAGAPESSLSALAISSPGEANFVAEDGADAEDGMAVDAADRFPSAGIGLMEAFDRVAIEPRLAAAEDPEEMTDYDEEPDYDDEEED